MYKDIVFPVSVEEFAAYLDGNLPEAEMSRVSSMIHNDSSMQELMKTSQLVSDTMGSYSPIDLELPKEILDRHFSMPEFVNWVGPELNNYDWEASACAIMSETPDDNVAITDEDINTLNCGNVVGGDQQHEIADVDLEVNFEDSSFGNE